MCVCCDSKAALCSQVLSCRIVLTNMLPEQECIVMNKSATTELHDAVRDGVALDIGTPNLCLKTGYMMP